MATPTDEELQGASRAIFGQWIHENLVAFSVRCAREGCQHKMLDHTGPGTVCNFSCDDCGTVCMCGVFVEKEPDVTPGI